MIAFPKCTYLQTLCWLCFLHAPSSTTNIYAHTWTQSHLYFLNRTWFTRDAKAWTTFAALGIPSTWWTHSLVFLILRHIYWCISFYRDETLWKTEINTTQGEALRSERSFPVWLFFFSLFACVWVCSCSLSLPRGTRASRKQSALWPQTQRDQLVCFMTASWSVSKFQKNIQTSFFCSEWIWETNQL